MGLLRTVGALDILAGKTDEGLTLIMADAKAHGGKDAPESHGHVRHKEAAVAPVVHPEVAYIDHQVAKAFCGIVTAVAGAISAALVDAIPHALHLDVQDHVAQHYQDFVLYAAQTPGLAEPWKDMGTWDAVRLAANTMTQMGDYPHLTSATEYATVAVLATAAMGYRTFRAHQATKDVRADIEAPHAKPATKHHKAASPAPGP